MAEPRVNSVSLLSHQGRAVTLLGTVAEISGAQLVVTASDRKPVNVDVSAASVHHAGLAVGSLVDVVGTVQHGKLVATHVHSLPSSIDMDLYNEAVTLSAGFPTVF